MRIKRMKSTGQQRQRILKCLGVACVGLGVLALSVGSLLASGVVRDSVGATSSGRGGANIAHADNGPALLSNPASIVNIGNPQLFEFGVDTVFTDLDYSDPENNAATDFAVSPLPHVTYLSRSDDGSWGAGIGVYAPAGFSSDWELINPVFGEQTYSSFGALVKVLPGAAYRVTDRLSVGATLGVAVSHVELDTPFYVQTGLLAGAPALLDLQATGVTPTWSLGMQYQVSERTTVGVAYTSEDRFRLEGDADATILPGPISSSFDAEVDLVWPQSVGAGISHFVTDRHRVSADVVWYDWSHAFDQVDLKFTNASNGAVPLIVGPVLRDTFPLNWDDSMSVRLGYEFFRTPCDVIRAGYIYNAPNIPSSTLTPLIPATMEHSFTVGYGRCWQIWRSDFAYQYAFGPERSVGTSALVGGDFNDSDSQSQAHWLMVSFTR
jgi:long-subunit fatty acid transport protein